MNDHDTPPGAGSFRCADRRAGREVVERSGRGRRSAVNAPWGRRFDAGLTPGGPTNAPGVAVRSVGSAVRVAAFLAAAGFAACGGEPPTMEIGAIAVPEATYTALAEPERRTLADLVAFGHIVARDDLDVLVTPLVEREVRLSRLASLAFHLGAEANGIDETALRDAYAGDPEWELLVRHVVRLVDPATPRARRDSARSIAEEVARRAAAGEDFATLAARFSEEPGAAERGGLLQPGRHGSWVDAFWSAAVALQPGETSAVVESEYGYHVLRLDERRPVPFEEAGFASVLRSAVPIDVASSAMEDWVASDGRIFVERTAVTTALNAVLDGTAIADSLVLATDRRAAEYTGADLAAGWATLPPEERAIRESEDGAAFYEWVQEDARRTLWGRYSEAAGVPVQPTAADDARRRWSGAAARWAAAFGFEQGMSDREVVDAALAGLLSGSQEPRAARLEIRSLRPHLRRLYPIGLAP